MDIKVLYALKQGNEDAFEAIFRKYNAKIYHFVKDALYDKILAEDITQNVFLSVWEHRKDIIPEKNFSAYLYTIAKNKVFRETEKMVLSYLYEGHIHQMNLNKEDLSTEEIINANSLREAIFQLIDKLPEARKKIFFLHFTEDLSNKEIAARLSVSEENVAQQIRRSLDYIRKHLTNYIALLGLISFL
ncbi:MAG: RNA polymerase sigma-70 factor [Dysgonamonadaceae bacterium]|jgi:RNA polymerase sigma-70 factor (ECF subfamily)|nr:RNA polymerase sigma-70 factor [Dysgonamonadaceae bacterium]